MAVASENPRQAFKLLAGDHHDENGRTYRKGDIVYTHHDLIRGFPNKFKRVSVVHHTRPMTIPSETYNSNQEPTEPIPAPVVEDVLDEEEDTIAEVQEDDTDDDEIGLSEQDLGRDVTTDFPKARRAGLHVYKKSRNFTVTTVDQRDALNLKPLTSRKQVNDLIDDLG